MSIDEIRAYRNAKPFREFHFLLSDGRLIHVNRPERLGIAPWGKVGVFEGVNFHLLSPEEIDHIRPSALAA